MLSERIRQLRLIRGLSQVELANLLNVSKQSISNWENDNIQPSIEMLIKISEVFSVSADYLLGKESNRRIDVTGLTDKEIDHIQIIIDDIKSNKNGYA